MAKQPIARCRTWTLVGDGPLIGSEIRESAPEDEAQYGDQLGSVIRFKTIRLDQN